MMSCVSKENGFTYYQKKDWTILYDHNSRGSLQLQTTLKRKTTNDQKQTAATLIISKSKQKHNCADRANVWADERKQVGGGGGGWRGAEKVNIGLKHKQVFIRERESR